MPRITLLARPNWQSTCPWPLNPNPNPDPAHARAPPSHAVIRTVGPWLKIAFVSAFGSLQTYFEVVAKPLHQWMVRVTPDLDFFVRFDTGDVVRAREDSTDRLMAMLHIFSEGTQSNHALYRAQAGGSDEDQRRRHGVPLFRSWRNLIRNARELEPAGSQYGAVWPIDPDQPMGSFVNTHRLALEEVAANFEIATNSQRIWNAAALQWPYNGAAAIELGPVERALRPSDAAYAWCASRARDEIPLVIEGSSVPIGSGGATVSFQGFDLDADVTELTCTPWDEGDGRGVVMHVVATFSEERFGEAALLQTVPGGTVLTGEARAHAAAGLVATSRNGFSVWTGECFCSIDARLQNRVCISRGAVHRQHGQKSPQPRQSALV